MLSVISSVTTLLAILVVIAQIVIVAYLVLLFFSKWFVGVRKFCHKIEQYGLHLALLVSIVAVSGSLFYSEYADYYPCLFCWLQRITIFPQVLLLLVAKLRNDWKVVFYTVPLAVIGLLIAVYHFSVQMLATYTTHDAAALVPCQTVGMTPSCVEYYVIKFGYITIPMMSITTLLAISLGVIAYYRFNLRKK